MIRTGFALLCLAAAASTAPPIDWAAAPRLEVRLANFSYAPETIRLSAGQPVVLRLANASSGGHDFTAPAFFAAAQVRAEDRAAIVDGGVEVAGRASREIGLVPSAGRYPLKCGHAFHKLLGMSGAILVE